MHFVKPKIFPLVENTNNKTINNEIFPLVKNTTNETINDECNAARNGKIALVFSTLRLLVLLEL